MVNVMHVLYGLGLAIVLFIIARFLVDYTEKTYRKSAEEKQ